MPSNRQNAPEPETISYLVQRQIERRFDATADEIPF
jgi:hypothetical protein